MIAISAAADKHCAAKPDSTEVDSCSNARAAAAKSRKSKKSDKAKAATEAACLFQVAVSPSGGPSGAVTGVSCEASTAINDAQPFSSQLATSELTSTAVTVNEDMDHTAASEQLQSKQKHKSAKPKRAAKAKTAKVKKHKSGFSVSDIPLFKDLEPEMYAVKNDPVPLSWKDADLQHGQVGLS